jgi:hypothetical protein
LNPEEVAEEMEGNLVCWRCVWILAINCQLGQKKKLDAEQEVAFSSICDICVDL